jgi:mono/diheme cytochrome c family protein
VIGKRLPTSAIILTQGLVLILASTVSAQQLLENTIGDYCTDCHNDQLKTGGVTLEHAGSGSVASQAALLERVLHKLRAGEMPPPGNPAPDAAQRASLVHWLETQLDAASAAHPNPGAPAIHRLNKAEYSNAIRDLLGLDMDNSAGLPADDSGYGFDNIGDVLTVSPMHMEKYVSSARRISRLAVGTLKAGSAIEKFPSKIPQNDSLDELPLNERGEILLRRYFPFDAEYSIVVRVRGNPAPGLPAPKLDVRLDGKRVKLIDAEIDTAEANQGTRSIEVRMPLPAGEHSIGAGFLSESAKLETGGGGGRGGTPPPPPPPVNGVSVEYISIGGPYHPTGPGNTESRQRIFICRPPNSEGKTGGPEDVCARQILASLARRAYRRPVTAPEIDPLMKLFAAGRADGGNFDSGVEMGLSGILVSPEFLFRVEAPLAPSSQSKGAIYRLPDLDLASRLSFFIWSSIPDEELLGLAERGKLHDPAVLGAQVRRMLADAKSKALVENFAGQWLRLRNVADWKPDPDKFKEVDETLRNTFERETELFFENIVAEDRSVLEFIDADYTFLNERLAKYYGIQGVKGSYFRRVALKSPERGGILTQASVLMVTSYPTRTSPVLRGKWILESILNAPPPPPPPNVPALDETTSTSARSLRETFEKHRANVACASCHSRLDPLGFSLENFDAGGKYRSKEGDEAIDASGNLPDGTVIDGVAGLKKILLARKDEFVEGLADKLLTYALGRGLEYYDQPVVRDIRRQAEKNDYRFSSLVLAIVNSLPFEMRRVPE